MENKKKHLNATNQPARNRFLTPLSLYSSQNITSERERTSQSAWHSSHQYTCWRFPSAYLLTFSLFHTRTPAPVRNRNFQLHTTGRNGITPPPQNRNNSSRYRYKWWKSRKTGAAGIGTGRWQVFSEWLNQAIKHASISINRQSGRTNTPSTASKLYV